MFIVREMLLLDLETQSYPVESGIYEVACLAVRDYEVVDQLYLGKEIDGYIGDKRWGNGFYDISEDEESMARFQDFVLRYPYPIVAHNCGFDKKFLLYYEWVENGYAFYCSIRAIRREVSSLDSYALDKLVSFFEIAEKTEHRAMADTLHLYELLKLIKPEIWLKVGDRDYRRKKSKSRPKIKARTLAEIDLPIPTTDILAGEKICFTGKSDFPRYTMHEIAIKNGAEISRSVSSTTTLLVVGIKAGSKLDEALANDIPIVSDEEFMGMLDLRGLRDESAFTLEE